MTVLWLRALLVFDVALFMSSSLLHAGLRVPLGGWELAEPRLTPALIVEGLSGCFLLVSAVGVFTARPWAWPAAFFAHAFAGAGVLLGIYALTVGWGPRTVVNDVAHRVMLLALVAGLLALSTGSVRHDLHFGG
jgi:hypothetical protein